MEDLTIKISSEMLSATVEAMQELKMRYEMEAWAFARMPVPRAQETAEERLEAAATAEALFRFFAKQ